MPKKKELKVRGFVPDGQGGYRPYEELDEKEKDEFARRLVDRIGASLNDYFSFHPEAYAEI